jgi:hypothetical protein
MYHQGKITDMIDLGVMGNGELQIQFSGIDECFRG